MNLNSVEMVIMGFNFVVIAMGIGLILWLKHQRDHESPRS